MKILFIGGTGRLSSDVAKLALEKNNDVYLLTRGSNNRKKFVDPRYKMIYGNIRDTEECKKKLKDFKFDVIIDFLTFNTEQLENTLDVIKNHYKQYIFISTATVYSKNNEDEIISENKTIVGNKKWKYAYDKFLCEEKIKEYFSDNEEATYTIVRPYVTYNETRIPYPIIPQNNMYEYSLINRIINEKCIPIINNGDISTTITNSKDFAKAVVGLLNNSSAYGEAFHITSNENVTWENVIDYIGQYYDKDVKKVNFSIDEFSNKYPEYRGILEGDKGHSMKFDNSKIKKVVPDFECEVCLKDGIKKCIQFFEDNEEFKKIDYYWDGKIDKICNCKKEKEFSNKGSKIEYFCGYYGIPKKIYKIIRKIGGTK